MARPFKCPYCESTKSIWKGYRKRQNDRVRLRKCSACKRKWTTQKQETMQF